MNFKKRPFALFALPIRGSFRPPFSKGGGVEGRSPHASQSALRLAFLFDNFFFAPQEVKEKVAMDFALAIYCSNCGFFAAVQTNRADGADETFQSLFSLQEGGANKKMLRFAPRQLQAIGS